MYPQYWTPSIVGTYQTRHRFLCLIPFLRQEEIADISVFDPVSAHIELIEGNNVLRKVIADAVIANLSVITDKIQNSTNNFR